MSVFSQMHVHDLICFIQLNVVHQDFFQGWQVCDSSGIWKINTVWENYTSMLVEPVYHSELVRDQTSIWIILD